MNLHSDEDSYESNAPHCVLVPNFEKPKMGIGWKFGDVPKNVQIFQLNLQNGGERRVQLRRMRIEEQTKVFGSTESNFVDFDRSFIAWTLNLWTIAFNALNSWWINKMSFFQLPIANSDQSEGLKIANSIQNENCHVYFCVWKNKVTLIF